MTEVQQTRALIREAVQQALNAPGGEHDTTPGYNVVAALAALVNAVLLLGELVECSGVALAMLDGKLDRIASSIEEYVDR